ncbi:MAG: M36 family metallopeptidase, partial [Polyangiaceae bacterium]
MRSYRFRIGSLTAVSALLIGLPSCSSSQESPKPNQEPSSDPAQEAVRSADENAAIATIATTPMGRVIARNERGFARTVLSSDKSATPIRVTAETAARMHLVRHAKVLGAGEDSIRNAALTGTHQIAGGGTIVQFGQRVNGIEVFRTRASVLLDADKNLVSIANGLAPTALGGHVANKGVFSQTAEGALANAYLSRAGVKLGADSIRDLGPAAGAESRTYSIQTPAGALRILHATAKQVYYPSETRLVPSYYIEILTRPARSNDNQAWGMVVSAVDGSTLYQTSLTHNDTYNYRVWARADGDKVPMDGPIVDSTPYPGGVPDGRVIDNAAPVMVAMEGFNKNPGGTADPWLPTGATVTFGNNVLSYSDRNQYVDEAGADRNDGYNEGGAALDSGFDFRADITSALTFDRTYNLAQAPNASVNQIKAAVTQLFYVNNWLHDYWYDSGFNEAAGNAQASNYTRPGGAENDPILAEAQDSADSGQGNNANMSTLSDGISPRMQMYVWNGLPNRTITTTPAPSLTFPDGIGVASWSPELFDVNPTNTPQNAPVVFNDGTAPNTADACEPTSANYTGKIVLIDRGTCAFTVKALNAQAAGAVGVIMINHQAGHTPVNPGGTDPGLVNFPVLGVSQEDGAALKTGVAGGTITRLRLQRAVETKRDGTIDNGIVAHEWGHYFHHRTVLCGSQSCGGMSEGWGDFTALMMIIKEGDTFGPNVYPMAQY